MGGHPSGWSLNYKKRIMASTITSANLTVTISESIMINGIEQGNTNSVTIAGIKEVSRRIITVGTSGEAELVLLDANDGTAPFNESDVMLSLIHI